MKRMALFMILSMALTGCAAPQAQANVPNPASVYCTQNGNQLEIHTSADGSQHGICGFPDGSACDEWAYYRGECGPARPTSPAPATTVEAATAASRGTEEQASGGYMPPGTAEEIADWWGVIKSTPPGAQYDDYFERQDLVQPSIYFGIDSMVPAVSAQIAGLRD